MRIAILAHEQFPNHAKTAIGILRYSDHNVVARFLTEQRQANAFVIMSQMFKTRLSLKK